MVLTIIIIILILIVFVISYFENNNYITTSYDIHFDNLKSPIKLCFLSDLHGNKFGPNNEKLIDDIINLQPDVVLITGDLIVEKYEESYETAITFIKELSSKFYNGTNIRTRIFYSLGNHEEKALLDYSKKKLIGKLFKTCKDNNVMILDNNSSKIRINNQMINIAGISLGVAGYTKFTNKNITKELVDSCINKAYSKTKYSDKDINIVLSHHPYTFKFLNKYFLVLSGHFHGGLVRLPLIGGLFTPQPLAKGIITHGINKAYNSTHIVSSGLGWHSIPIRLFNRTEIVDITIK